MKFEYHEKTPEAKQPQEALEHLLLLHEVAHLEEEALHRAELEEELKTDLEEQVGDQCLLITKRRQNVGLLGEKMCGDAA